MKLWRCDVTYTMYVATPDDADAEAAAEVARDKFGDAVFDDDTPDFATATGPIRSAETVPDTYLDSVPYYADPTDGADDYPEMTCGEILAEIEAARESGDRPRVPAPGQASLSFLD